MNPPEQEQTCGAIMKRISDKMEKQANEEFESYGVTMTQFRMLMSLREIPDGRASLKTLEKYFGVAQSTAAGIAVRLERKGLVTSLADPSDKRIKIVCLTDAGCKICEDAYTNMENAERRLLKGLDEAEREQFLILLQKVYGAL